MKLLRHLPSIALTSTGCVATIGNFDGVHLGHQRVISQVRAHADRLDLPVVVISFEPLPAEYFRKPPPTRITPFRDKVDALAGLGVDVFVCLPFDRKLAGMEAEDFVRVILLDGLRTRHLVVGDDFRFGRARRGDHALLSAMGAERGMTVEDTPTFLLNGERVSSTRVRERLEQADIDGAAALLGRSYRLSGRVLHGDKRGRTIGFPTLNLRIPENVALRKGVYAVRVFGLEGSGDAARSGIANLGVRPTVNGLHSRLETHVFDFAGDVYGRRIGVEPVGFIRDERRFDSLERLQAQISQDVEQARCLLRI